MSTAFWRESSGWKIACLILAASVGLLTFALVRMNERQIRLEQGIHRLAADGLTQAQITHDVARAVRAQGETLDVVTRNEEDFSRIAVGLLRHAKQTSYIPVQIEAKPEELAVGGPERFLASKRRNTAVGWVLASEIDKTGERRFTWPVRGGLITSPYGPRWGGFHPGLDISVPYGTPIHAAAAGRVTEAGYSGGYGNLTVIAHDGGFSTAYGHQSRIAVSVGQRVSQEQVIGYVGSTGFSTGNHLHFEIRSRGSTTDPLPFLSGK